MKKEKVWVALALGFAVVVIIGALFYYDPLTPKHLTTQQLNDGIFGVPRAAGTEMAPESNWNPTLLYTLNRLALLHQVIPEEAMIISVGEKIEGGVVPVLITREKGDTYSCFARTPGAFSFLTRNTLRAGNTGTMLTVLEPGATEFRHPKSCFFIPN